VAGYKPGEVAKQVGVSRQTVHKWVRRFRAEGDAGLADRSSRPHSSPTRTSSKVTARITAARMKFAGPVALSGLLSLPASTIGAVLRRERMPALCHLDRVTGEVIKGRRYSDLRYEHRDPGSLLHVDVKKLGKIPPGGGWRLHGRGTATPRGRGKGWDFVHVAIDDHSRVAYSEILPDEKGATCAGFLYRAAKWFHDEHDVTIRRVLTDNAKNYLTSRDWITVCKALQIKRRYIKPHCPWINGKAERFNQTLLTEWAYSRSWTYNHQRTRALDSFLRRYNTRRGHSALGGRPPGRRLAA